MRSVNDYISIRENCTCLILITSDTDQTVQSLKLGQTALVLAQTPNFTAADNFFEMQKITSDKVPPLMKVCRNLHCGACIILSTAP